MNSNPQAKRTLLYYPTVEIPTGRWLRQALLYWDDVASMCPKEWTDREDLLSADLKYLEEKSEYRRILLPSGDDTLDSPEVHQIAVETIKIAGLRRPSGPELRAEHWIPFAADRFSRGFLEFLHREGVAIPYEGRAVPVWQRRRREPAWGGPPDSDNYLVPTRLAYAYLGLLAQYLAEREPSSTLPATDHPYYQHLAFCAGEADPSFPAATLKWSGIIPIPTDDVTLADIIEFKAAHRAELVKFRRLLLDWEQSIAESTSPVVAKEAMADLSERTRTGVEELAELLRDSRMASTFGSMCSLINIKSSTFWAAAALAMGRATDLAKIPTEWALAGIAASGAIELASYWIQQRNERNATLRQSPFSYLYHARQNLLIE